MRKNLLYLLVIIFFVNVTLLVIFYLKNTIITTNNTRSTSAQGNPTPISLPTISIHSEIPEITHVEISDLNYIQSKLNELEFWNSYKNIFEMKKAIYSDIRSLDILLTNKPQNHTQIMWEKDGKQFIAYSVGLSFDASEKKITMLVHISDEAIKSINNDNSALEKTMSYLILRRAYGVKNPVHQNQDADFAENVKSFISIKLDQLK